VNYEIVTSRWICPDCGSPLRLVFTQTAAIEESAQAEAYSCDRVFCNAGHPVSEEFAQEVMGSCNEEFYQAMEQGAKIGEVWLSPSEAPADMIPNDMLPPEE